MVISVEEGLRRVVNNKKLYFKLLKSFNGRGMAEQITQAIQKEEYKEAAAICHALRGTAANLAMHPLADAVKKVEERLKSGECPKDLLPSLEENIKTVEAAIIEITEE